MITTAFFNIVYGWFGIIFGLLPTVSASPEWFTTYALPTFQVIGGLLVIPVVNTLVQIGLIYLAIISGWQLVPLYSWLYGKVRGVRA